MGSGEDGGRIRMESGGEAYANHYMDEKELEALDGSISHQHEVSGRSALPFGTTTSITYTSILTGRG